MKNFPFEYNGDTLWYSRSVAASGFIFAYDKQHELHVLLTLRGKSVESSPNMWSVPGGFLDFDEDLPGCVQREIHEETGLVIDRLLINYWNINSIPTTSPRQSITVMYYMILPGFMEDYHLSMDGMEKDEIQDLMWTPVSMLTTTNMELAFNNKNIILDMYNKLFVKSRI